MLKDVIRVGLSCYVNMLVKDVKKSGFSVYGVNYVDELKGIFYDSSLEELRDMENIVREQLEEVFGYNNIFVSEYNRHKLVLIIDGEVKKYPFQMVIFNV